MRKGVPSPFLNRGRVFHLRNLSLHKWQHGPTGWFSTGRPVGAGGRAPACGLFTVRPWHRRFRAPPLREFNARLLWSASALRNVSCVLETHTRASERKRPPHLDYVFDQHKHVEEIIEWAHGKAWRNESLPSQDLHNFIDVLHGDNQLQVGQPLLICFLV